MERRLVGIVDRRAVVEADAQVLAEKCIGVDRGARDVPTRHDDTIDEQIDIALEPTGGRERVADAVRAGGEWRGRHPVAFLAEHVVHVVEAPTLHVERVAAESTTVREEHAVVALGQFDRGHGERRPVTHIDGGRGGHRRSRSIDVARAMLDMARSIDIDRPARMERQRTVATSLSEPEFDHLAQPRGVGFGEIIALGGVLGHVIELPAILAEGGVGIGSGDVHLPAHRVVRNGLPAVVVDRPAAEQLVVLRGALLVGAAIGERLEKAHALDRLLRYAIDDVGHGDADGVEHGRHDVDGVEVLRSHGAAVGDAGGPVHDERIGDTTLMALALPALEGRVARMRPAIRVMAMGERATQFVEMRQHRFERQRHAVVPADGVEGAVLVALR